MLDIKNTELEIDTQFDIFDGPVLEAIKFYSRRLIEDIYMFYSDNHWNPKFCKNKEFLRDPFWPSLCLLRDKNEFKYNKLTLILVPLDRVGAAQGASGCKVTICYFVLSNVALRELSGNDYKIISLPLILKFEYKTSNKLQLEFDNAQSVKVFADHSDGCFALPLKFDDEHERISVLWSSFKSNNYFCHSSVYGLGQTADKDSIAMLTELNLWKLIKEYNEQNDERTFSNIQNILNVIYSNLKPFHLRLGYNSTEVRNIIEEYRWYLRGIESEKDNSWRNIWENVWADKTIKLIDEFGGKSWVNPIYILEQLNNFNVSLHMGSVHGDLHPRNIVISHGNIPHMIDFAWSQDMVHIVKDFVLMECNFRFVVLKSQIKYSDCLELAKSITNESLNNYMVKSKNIYLSKIASIIKLIRDKLIEHIGSQINWNEEYIVPLFLVSMGLLRFIDSYNNQTATRLTILELAKYINDEIITKKEDCITDEI